MTRFILVCLALFNILTSEIMFFVIPLKDFKFEILFIILTFISIVNFYNYLNTGE